MRAEFIKAIANCTLINGELRVPGITSEADIKSLGDEVRDLILKGELPFYKVVGVKITTGNANLLTDYITKAKGVNRSYAELLNVFGKLIYAETDGEIKESRDESCKLSVHNCGYIMGIDGDIKSDNGTLFYEGKGVNAKPESLTKGLEVIRFYNPGTCIHLIVRRGTGSIEFSEVSNLLYKTDYVPVGQSYDLSNVLSVKMWEKGDNSVIFRYKTSINEKVLERILRNYTGIE